MDKDYVPDSVDLDALYKASSALDCGDYRPAQKIKAAMDALVEKGYRPPVIPDYTPVDGAPWYTEAFHDALVKKCQPYLKDFHRDWWIECHWNDRASVILSDMGWGDWAQEVADDVKFVAAIIYHGGFMRADAGENYGSVGVALTMYPVRPGDDYDDVKDCMPYRVPLQMLRRAIELVFEMSAWDLEAYKDGGRQPEIRCAGCGWGDEEECECEKFVEQRVYEWDPEA